MPARASAALPLPTSDLRRNARETNRARTHNAKWVNGGRPAAGSRCPHTPFTPCDCAARPVLNELRGNPFVRRHEHSHNAGKKVKGERVGLRADLIDELSATTNSDSSAGEEVPEASAAPEPDADVMYSYDAKRGPGAGSQILSQAITKAVERFENKETEDMVRKEYEVVDGYEGEKEAGGYDADEDEFELVEKDGLA